MHSNRSRNGIALPMMAVLTTVFLGFLGLVFDTGYMVYKKRTMQAAADAAAVDGAYETLRANSNRITSAGKYSARINGYTDGADNVTVVINNPPAAGPNQNARHVEAVVSQTSPTFFLGILGIGSTDVSARAVAGWRNAGDFCVLALDPSNGLDALLISGTAGVSADCGFRSNSCFTDGSPTGGDASFRVKGTSGLQLTAIPQPQAVACGDVREQGGAIANPHLITDAATEPDPFAGLTQPTVPATADWTNLPTINGNATLSPGYYASTDGTPAIEVSNGAVTFNPGLYIVEGLRITGGTVTAPDATFFNTGVGTTFHIGGNATMDFTARSIDDSPVENQHILFWCDANSPTLDGGGNRIEHQFRGTADDNLTGVIYCPTQHTDWAGTYDSANGEWGMIVSNTIEFTGTSAVNVVGPPPTVIQDLDLQTIVMKE
ncbi:MAG TPA: pilus assembly protein TadG-related protein [Bryobacterales bacterium]|nr:pilus assembly protein TadG-related protein [Bryobacterales bacterium]